MCIKVRAKQMGYYEGRRRKGDEFEIETRKQLGSWMEEIKKPKKSSKPAAESAAKSGGKPAAESAAKSSGDEGEGDPLV